MKKSKAKKKVEREVLTPVVIESATTVVKDGLVRTVDTTRHITLFDPEKMGRRKVDIIGCGAIGSKVALSLAKMGVFEVHLWDFDTVAEHNLANQVYTPSDIGKPKVEALTKLIREQTYLEYTPHNQKYEGGQLGDIVFMCVDTMEARKLILKNVDMNLKIFMTIDVRMGADILRVYSFDPRDPRHVKKYSDTLTSDEKADVSYCGSRISVGPTASICAEIAVWQFLKWFNREYPVEHEEAKERDNNVTNEIIFCLRPTHLIQNSF